MLMLKPTPAMTFSPHHSHHSHPSPSTVDNPQKQANQDNKLQVSQNPDILSSSYSSVHISQSQQSTRSHQ